MAKILPEDFRKYTLELMGEELYQQLEQGITEGEAPTSIRLNPFKCKEGEDVNSQKEEKDVNSQKEGEQKVMGEPIPWCPSTGRYLATRPNFTFDPWLHAGKYYVQEASSMFVDLVIRQLVHEPVMMLDLCAAPGGKSTAVRAALPEGSLLFSNEPMRTRSQILAENIQKFGHPDMIVTNNYPRDYKKSKLQFDVILTDVPCSGEGMFRKDDGAIAEWNLQNVDNCWHLQREIVSDIWSCLKPGGILIYSTCTFNAHEDEENIAWICEELGAEPVALTGIDDSWNITGNLIGSSIPVYRFLPGKTRGEGIFLAVLRKEGEEEENVLLSYAAKAEKDRKKGKAKKGMNADQKGKAGKGNKNNAGKAGKSNKNVLTMIPGNWIRSTSDALEDGEYGMGYDYQKTEDGDVYAIPQRWQYIYELAKNSLKVIHAGIKLGTDKGKGLIPDQCLALSTMLNTDAFPQEDLSYEDAIRYLRKEAVTLHVDSPKKYVLVTYQGVPLGWEKNIGNRANNLYPQEWKIKSTHVPEKQIIINSL